MYIQRAKQSKLIKFRQNKYKSNKLKIIEHKSETDKWNNISLPKCGTFNMYAN